MSSTFAPMPFSLVIALQWSRDEALVQPIKLNGWAKGWSVSSLNTTVLRTEVW